MDERGALGMDSGSRPQEDVEVERQRDHPDGASRGARIGWRALLGGVRPPWSRHRLRYEPDAGRPATGNQAFERIEVRAGIARATRADHGSGRPRAARKTWRAGG